jgi:hypothetical protein
LARTQHGWVQEDFPWLFHGISPGKKRWTWWTGRDFTEISMLAVHGDEMNGIWVDQHCSVHEKNRHVLRILPAGYLDHGEKSTRMYFCCACAWYVASPANLFRVLHRNSWWLGKSLELLVLPTPNPKDHNNITCTFPAFCNINGK